jgi:hypothetical protein
MQREAADSSIGQHPTPPGGAHDVATATPFGGSDEAWHAERAAEGFVTWIERKYHRRRRQDALGRLTFIEYEAIMTTTATQAA